MMIELKIRGFNVVAQKPVKVYYKGAIVGDYYADIVVENMVIVELKATDVNVEGFEWQCKLSSGNRNGSRSTAEFWQKA